MNWTLEKEIVKEAEYIAGSWHMQKDADGVYISNWELMMYPIGRGADEKKAFLDMLERIEAYKSTLEAVKAEIESRLAEMKEKENV